MPTLFTPAKRARSPITFEKGATSLLSLVLAPVNDDSPMRQNWWIPTIAPSTA